MSGANGCFHPWPGCNCQPVIGPITRTDPNIGNQEIIDNLLRQIEKDKEKVTGTKKTVQHFKAGNYISYFETDERCFATQINERVTVFHAIDSGVLVGFHVALSSEEPKPNA